MKTRDVPKHGIVTAPHALASDAGIAVLREGGNAIEAAVAVAAALAVVYPHMNSIGGDNFWLVAESGRAPIGIDACGRSGEAIDIALYRQAGLNAVPWRGALAANTIAGAISGWEAALELGSRWATPTLPLSRLLRDAIHHAENGFPATLGLVQTIAAKRAELLADPGFADVFGSCEETGAILKQPALAATLRRLARDGLADFYRGALTADILHDLQAAGGHLTAADFAEHRADTCTPLHTDIAGARIFNLPPPTQGFASLLILALFDRIRAQQADGFDHIHRLVEATKRAFALRDRHIGDPDHLTIDLQANLDDMAFLRELAERIDLGRAAPWPLPPSEGDTVWFGVIDAAGRAVSVIQSTYFEFGSGIVLPQTGVTWQNRGAGFSLSGSGPNMLEPRRKPFHTLNPALARFTDGRTLVYGTMGGEGQPQTQAAIFTRYADFRRTPQQAVDAPRWLLGRTWGEDSTSLKIEDRFAPETIAALRAAGHAVEIVKAFDGMMGHAGMLVRNPDGSMEGATDPRSDGGVRVS